MWPAAQASRVTQRSSGHQDCLAPVRVAGSLHLPPNSCLGTAPPSCGWARGLEMEEQRCTVTGLGVPECPSPCAHRMGGEGGPAQEAARLGARMLISFPGSAALVAPHLLAPHWPELCVLLSILVSSGVLRPPAWGLLCPLDSRPVHGLLVACLPAFSSQRAAALCPSWSTMLMCPGRAPPHPAWAPFPSASGVTSSGAGKSPSGSWSPQAASSSDASHREGCYFC